MPVTEEDRPAIGSLWRPPAPPWRGAPRRVAHGHQAGFSLIESLIAVALAGLLILAVSTAMFTMLRITGETSRSQKMSTALVNSTESLRSTPYRPCGANPAPTTARYDSDQVSDPTAWHPQSGSGISVTVTKVEYWVGTTPGSFGGFEPSCPAGGDQGRQRLTVRVSMTDRPSVSGTVVIAEPQLEPGA